MCAVTSASLKFNIEIFSQCIFQLLYLSSRILSYPPIYDQLEIIKEKIIKNTVVYSLLVAKIRVYQLAA